MIPFRRPGTLERINSACMSTSLYVAGRADEQEKYKPRAGNGKDGLANCTSRYTGTSPRILMGRFCGSLWFPLARNRPRGQDIHWHRWQRKTPPSCLSCPELGGINSKGPV